RLNRPSKSFIVRLLSLPRRVGQASITLTADFIAANFARDTVMGSIMSRHGFKFVVDSARGLASRVKADQNYRDFVANGGGFSSYLVDEAAFRTHLERFYTRKGIDYGTVLDSPAKMLLGLERVADAFEVATRLGEFRKAIEKGEHPRHAAYSAREVSTDFGMRGDSEALGFMYDTVIFLKAGMNGIDRLYRGLAHDPNRAAIAAKTALLAAASAGLYALNRDNPLYDDMEDWDKDTHWHLFVPTSETLQAWADGRELPPLKERYHHLRYPKIWEIGAVASIAERTLGRFLDGQPAELARDTGRIMRDVLGFEYLPQAIAPLAEQAMNRNRFLDRPIETQAMKS
ncbi:MAG: LPD38 domain-containing protein, partial [Rhodospirillales bacterium]